MIQATDNVLTDTAVDAIHGAEAIGVPTPRELMTTAVKTAMRSRGNVKRAGRLAAEGARIVAGRSDREPHEKDARFKDDAWHEHPAYRRLMQCYLAASDALDEAVEDADLDWRDLERARFLAAIVGAGLAPTNGLVTNPAALKRAFDTAGLSLVKGARNLVRDARHNGGMPAQVDRSAFSVGENIAVTPGAVIHRDEICEVIQYAPATPEVRRRPVLIVPPQIGRFYFLDLRPERSFIEYAVSQGLTIFLISWRNPGPEQRDWGMDDYAEAVLRSIDITRDVANHDDVNMLSFCAGGILSSTVLSHLAANDDERVNTASFGVTLLDFDVRAAVGAFDSGAALGIARAKSNRDGLITGQSLGAVFSLMRPNDLVFNYLVNNYLMGREPPAFDILAWNADSTNLPAKLHGEFLDIFEDNLLAQPGRLEVLGTPVDLSRIKLETYVTGATTDHLTPWRGCYRTTELMSGPSTFVLSSAGHIASLVNPPGNPKAHFFAGPEPGDDAEGWYAKAEERQGTWWEHWSEWITERSGDERRAPTKLGNKAHPPVDDAPGRYVRDLTPAAA